jgi:hypothetical protein
LTLYIRTATFDNTSLYDRPHYSILFYCSFAPSLYSHLVHSTKMTMSSSRTPASLLPPLGQISTSEQLAIEWTTLNFNLPVDLASKKLEHCNQIALKLFTGNIEFVLALDITATMGLIEFLRAMEQHMVTLFN